MSKGYFLTENTPLTISDGGTNATTAPVARTNLGIGTLGTQDANNVMITGGTITGMPAPTNPSDVSTKAYTDAVGVGLNVKNSCRVATTANLASLMGLLTIDGVTLNPGDRVLVKNQTSAFDNGIYDAAVGAWTRSADADTSAEVTSGLFTFIVAGTANAATGWILNTPNPITLGVTNLNFAQFSAGTAYTAGTGLQLIGNQFSIDATVATLTGTQTLQNKTLDNTNSLTIKDSNLTIQDNADTTKQAKFEASTIGTATTRTFTFPNADGTLALTSDLHAAVTLVGENYLSLTGQQITANPVNLSGSNATGTLAAGRFPALTGDVTNTAGSLATTISNGVVTNTKLADVPTSTIKGRITAGTGSPEDLNPTQAATVLGLGTLAFINSPLPVANGGTGATTASGARTNLGAAASGANSDITSMTGLTGELRAPTQVSSTTGNAVLKFASAGGGASSEVTITNSATDLPTISATGTATDINLRLQGKGTGSVSIPKVSITGGVISGTTLTDTNTYNVKDSLFFIEDDGDTTKRIAFQASGITTGTTRTLTAQDVSGTIYVTGGQDVSLLDGGTNASLTASNGGIFYSTATAGAILAGTATANQMLQSGATAAPTWSTSTWPASTTINQILYSSAANTVTGLATANNGVLVTGATGIPSISSTLPSGLILAGTLNLKRSSFTGTFTIGATDAVVIVGVNTSGGASTPTLPNATTVGAGRIYIISDENGNAATNNITVTAAGGQTINGAATYVMNINRQSISIYSDGGTNWVIF